jgi:hypothetical protein
MTVQRKECGGVVYYAAEALGTPHGFSTRLGGVSTGVYASLNLGLNTGDDPALVRENFRRFCDAVHVDLDRMVCSHQVHLDQVRVVTEADAGKGLDRPRDYEVDALVTDVPGLPLMITTADCIPVLLYDPVRRVVGACHAGWRGTALGIAARTVEQMVRTYGCHAADLRCAIGPGISQCCFETHADVPEAMQKALGDGCAPYIHRNAEDRFHVDLKGINRLWLERSGVLPEQIAVSDACTACDETTFYSHRRTGQPRGALTAVIQLS